MILKFVYAHATLRQAQGDQRGGHVELVETLGMQICSMKSKQLLSPGVLQEMFSAE